MMARICLEYTMPTWRQAPVETLEVNGAMLVRIDSEDALRTRDVIGVVQRTALEGDSRVRALFCVEW